MAGLLLSGVLLAACTGSDPEAAPRPSRPGSPSPETHRPAAIAPLDPTSSMTMAGAQLLAGSEFDSVSPRIDVTASADPAAGRVEGVVRADLPVGPEVRQARFRYFAGLESLDASLDTPAATVDGGPARATHDRGLITVGLPDGHGDSVVVELRFGYTLPQARKADPLDVLGGSLEPGEIGLLARHPRAMMLGHWFPVWIPEGRRADPAPAGFGDISNYPAADLSLRLTVPDGWDVVDSGVRVDESTSAGKVTVTSHGTGMRDLAVAVLRGFRSETRDVKGVSVTAWGPAQAADHLSGVLDETEAAFETLSAVFGGYPWREFDVVSAPLGAGVAGMEWPGATWIESSAFAGGIPGLGGLGELGDDLGELLGPLLGDQGGDLGLMLSSARPWTIAHEIAHEWWTILVGNDSIAAPVVDEPLAQYSACLVARATSNRGDEICQVQIAAGYAGLRASGDRDAAADRATDQFSSPAQYGGLIYGKAAWFYLALEKAYGRQRVAEALRALVSEHAFDMVSGADVRASLVSSLGSKAGALWDRWMQQAHGDEDMPETDLGGVGDLLGGIGDLDAESFEDLLGRLGG